MRSRLFSANEREGYSDVRVDVGEVRSVVLGNEDFAAYKDQIRSVLSDWRCEHAPCLHGLEVGDLPKALIRDMAEDLLRRFAGLPLVDRYAVYQCLMDYWDEVMQDDVYLVVAEGWVDAARPRVLVPARGRGTAESADLTVKRKKYKMDLLPPDLVVAEYFVTEWVEVDLIRAEAEEVARKLEEFIEEHSGEDGLLGGARTDAGKVTQAAVKVRLKEVRDDPDGGDERDALEACLELMKSLAEAKRRTKAAQTELDSKALNQYASLTMEEIAEIVVEDKWMASVERAIGQEVERLAGELVERVSVLTERYADALPELERRVEDYGAKVESHLRSMGLPAAEVSGDTPDTRAR